MKFIDIKINNGSLSDTKNTSYSDSLLVLQIELIPFNKKSVATKKEKHIKDALVCNEMQKRLLLYLN